ncbi:MAG: MBL fold metallo-hydrolase [Verrucomicrobiota bacterium]
MEFKVFELGPIGTNAIIAYDANLGRAIVFDAPAGAFDTVSRFAEEHDLAIEALLLTHGHWDHMLDAHLFKTADVPVFAHRDDEFLLENPEAMAAFSIPGLTFNAVQVDTWVMPGETIELLDVKWEVRHVPGHCPGSLLFYHRDSETAIVGDAIFAGSVGRTDLPGGDFSLLERSIRTQVYTLPEATVLYPGHGPETSVHAEKATNPFIRV